MVIKHSAAETFVRVSVFLATGVEKETCGPAGSLPNPYPPEYPRPQFRNQGAVSVTNIFVGNLSYQTTSEELQEAFSQYGNVERVSVVTDRDTGQPRGFAFVEMTDPGEAQRAMDALNGKEVNGRTLNVNEARPRPAGGGGGGGGRGFGGGGGGGRGPGGGGGRGGNRGGGGGSGSGGGGRQRW